MPTAGVPCLTHCTQKDEAEEGELLGLVFWVPCCVGKSGFAVEVV